MGDFSLSGGVEIIGVISPTDTTDTYPVIDTLYGISHDISTGKRSTLDAIANKGFIKNRVLSPKSMAWHKRKRK